MRVRFYIEKRKRQNGKLLTKERPIFMTVAFHGKRVLIATKKNVDLHMWDPESQRVKDDFPEAYSINEWLNELKYVASETWISLASLSEKPGVSDFRTEFEKLRPRFSGRFFDVFLLFLEEGSEQWQKSTYLKLRSLFMQLKDFEKSENYSLSFVNLDEVFLRSFVNFQEKRGLGAYTIRKYVNSIVWFLNWASDKGYNVHFTYRKFYKMLKTEEEEVEKERYFLEWDELMKFSKFQTIISREERVRDLFALSCFTGIRFSELQRLKKGDIGVESIVIKAKGRKDRIVPLNKYSEEIIKKYENRYYKDNAALPGLSLVTYNKYIEIIAGKCGIDRMVEQEEGEVPLYKVLTSGAGVHTFIANALGLGISSEVISDYTGIAKDQRVALLKQQRAKDEMKKFDEL